MKQRNEKSSLRIGQIAARVLAHKSWNVVDIPWKDIRSLAASVLTQLPDRVKRKLKGERPWWR